MELETSQRPLQNLWWFVEISRITMGGSSCYGWTHYTIYFFVSRA